MHEQEPAGCVVDVHRVDADVGERLEPEPPATRPGELRAELRVVAWAVDRARLRVTTFSRFSASMCASYFVRSYMLSQSPGDR